MAKYELVPNQEREAETKPCAAAKNAGDLPSAVAIGWTAEGTPVGEPIMQRSQWETGLFSCLGKNDEFYSSDLEVCLLGSVAPCVLHGSNVERLGSGPGSFANHCLPYSGLYLIGNCFLVGIALRPGSLIPTVQPFATSLTWSCETATRSCGCCGNYLMDEIQREQCETTCDFGTHVLCHACALCQEAREVRRRLPHPGLTTKPVFVMAPPGGQSMGRAVEPN